MTASLAILRALARAARRNLGTFGSLKVNNFFLFVVLMAYGALDSGVMPVSAYPFLLLIGTLLLLPLSSDPLALVPASRRALWPLRVRERVALRLSSLLFSPVSWIAIAILIRTARPGPALLFGAAVIGLHGLAPAAAKPLQWIPRAPGPFGELARNHARQMFFVLDTYLAIVLAAAGLAWRLIDPNAAPESGTILAILVGLALSTQAQSLFSLDGGPGATRSRLLPLPAWQILFAKDIAWFALLLLLTLPFDPASGAVFGFMVLAVGRYPSLARRIAVERWRFAGGQLLFGILQVVPAIALAMARTAYGPVVLLPVACLYALSVRLGGLYLFHDTVVRE